MPPGVYVSLGSGYSSVSGNPVYNLCEMKVWNLGGLEKADPYLGKMEVTDHDQDGKLDIIYRPSIEGMHTVAFLNNDNESWS